MSRLEIEIPGRAAGAAAWLMASGMTADAAAALKDIPLADLGLRRLLGAAEIGKVAGLRGEIDLAAAAAADPDFMHREKKETSWVWSSPSNLASTSSAPSAWYPCATA